MSPKARGPGSASARAPVFAVVRVPSRAEEDFKRLHRERQQLVKERTVNRIKALLAGQGIYGFQPRRADAVTRLADLRTGDGRVLAPSNARSVHTCGSS